MEPYHTKSGSGKSWNRFLIVCGAHLIEAFYTAINRFDVEDPDDQPMAPVPSYLDAQKVEKLIDFVKESPQAVDKLVEFMKFTGADLDQDLSIEQLRNVNQLIFRGFGDLWLLSSFRYRVSVK